MAVAVDARPQGPYTDRGPLVCQEVGSIDAAAVRDENGRRYLVWKEDGNSRIKRPTPLWAQRLTEDGHPADGRETGDPVIQHPRAAVSRFRLDCHCLRGIHPEHHTSRGVFRL